MPISPSFQPGKDSGEFVSHGKAPTPLMLNLQPRYDMETAREILQDKIDKEVRPFSYAA